MAGQFCVEINSTTICISRPDTDEDDVRAEMKKHCGERVGLLREMIRYGVSSSAATCSASPIEASTLALTAPVIYRAGVFLGMWGAYQFFMDVT